jgi:hypothetical protein
MPNRNWTEPNMSSSIIIPLPHFSRYWILMIGKSGRLSQLVIVD